MESIEKLKHDDFLFVQDLIYKETGIVIADHKKEMIYRRLSKRARALNLVGLEDYCDMLKKNKDKEITHFINAVTTNLTSFFRENHHFEYLREEYFPYFVKTQKKRLRIWSSAASTGEEPYSIAMTMLDSLNSHIHGMDAKILATDLDTNVLKVAKTGEYHQDRIKDLPKSIVSKWFANEKDKPHYYLVDKKLKDYLTFNPLNLLGSWPMKGKFDVIFCRNVLIYFDKETQIKLVDRFLNILNPGGILMLGHSESVLKGSKEFEHLGKTIYRKSKDS